MRPLPLLLAAAALLAGCNESLPSRALVDDLRVLGVRADPPEAEPGQTVTFFALVGDAEVPARPFRRGWALCTPGEGGVATCGDPDRVAVLGTGDFATWDVPVDFLDELSPEAAEIGRDVYVVLGIELEGLEGQPGQGEHDVAFKRVRVSTSPSPNTNPSIAAFRLDGAESSNVDAADGGDRLDLEVSVDGADDDPTEELRATWLVTAGSVGETVSWAGPSGVALSSWKLPGGGSHAMVWVVVRDGRGGTAWTSRMIEVR